MRLVCAAALIAALVIHAADAAAQAAPAPVPSTSTQSQSPPGGAPSPQPGTQASPQPQAAQTPTASRAFTAPVGLLFHTVRPERVADFEQVIARVQAALAKSTDPQVQAQAKGWRILKVSEPGPNGVVLYVSLMDPTVPGADYGFARLLADAYPDVAELQEIWRLYTTSVTGGGNLLNLTPVMPTIEPLDQRKPAPAPTSPPTPSRTPASPPPTVDTNPNVPGGPAR